MLQKVEADQAEMIMRDPFYSRLMWFPKVVSLFRGHPSQARSVENFSESEADNVEWFTGPSISGLAVFGALQHCLSDKRFSGRVHVLRIRLKANRPSSWAMYDSRWEVFCRLCKL